MRGLIIAIAIVLSAVLPAAAQFRFGVEAGLNASTADTGDKGRAGFNVGATGEYSFTPDLLIEASLKLSSQPFKFDTLSGDYTQSDDYQIADTRIESYMTPYYLVLPLRGAYRFNFNQDLKLTGGVGPTFGLGLFGRYSTKLTSPSMVAEEHSNSIFGNNAYAPMSTSRFECGASVKATLEIFKHYTVGAEYNYYNISGSLRSANHMNLLSVTVGYKF